MSCDYWRRPDASSGPVSRMKTCSVLGMMLGGLFSGCAHGMSPPTLPSLFSRNSISGQYEPKIDYEAEAAAREQHQKQDSSVKK